MFFIQTFKKKKQQQQKNILEQ